MPAAFVPDNLKSGVTRAYRYDTDLNPANAELAAHYNVAILSARVRKPRDKAKVENALLIVKCWILACLRHRQFFNLAELNEAIAQLLIKLNKRRFKKLEGNLIHAFSNSMRRRFLPYRIELTNTPPGKARRCIRIISYSSNTAITRCHTS